MNAIKQISCPTCNKNNTWKVENLYRPFCSERCRLLDLGEWASENYRLPTKEKINNDDLIEDETL